MKKVCSNCKENVSISNFHKNKSSKDGLQNNCKRCQSVYTSLYVKNNKEYTNKRQLLKYHFNTGKISEKEYIEARKQLRIKYNIEERASV